MRTQTFTNQYSEDNFDVELCEEKSYVLEKIASNHKKMNKENFLTTYTVSCNVDWDFTIEMRSWGVKDISAYATRVDLTIMADYFYGTENMENEIEVDLKEWKIDSDRNSDSGDMFKVQWVTFDFKEKLITVSF